MRNPFAPKSVSAGFSSPEHQSAGILDNHAIRQSVETQEINVQRSNSSGCVIQLNADYLDGKHYSDIVSSVSGSFVPYTGATGNVNLGSNTFTASQVYAKTGTTGTYFTPTGIYYLDSGTPRNFGVVDTINHRVAYELPTGTTTFDFSGDLRTSDGFTGGSITSTNFISDTATGTQPYACTSTTLNTNLNTDLLDGNHGSYYEVSGASIGKYVLSGSLWTDLTDGGATTLHKHEIKNMDWADDWMIIYSNNTGLQQLTFNDASGKFLRSNGESALSWESVVTTESDPIYTGHRAKTISGTNLYLSGSLVVSGTNLVNNVSGCVLSHTISDQDILIRCNDGGTTRDAIIVNSDQGSVTMPRQSCVNVTRGLNQTIATGSITKITIDTAGVDTLGEFDSANNQIVVKDAGVYGISVYGYFTTAVASPAITLVYIYIDGSTSYSFGGGSRVAYQTNHGTLFLKLNAGQTIDMRIYQNSGGNRDANGYIQLAKIS